MVCHILLRPYFLDLLLFASGSGALHDPTSAVPTKLAFSYGQPEPSSSNGKPPIGPLPIKALDGGFRPHHSARRLHFEIATNVRFTRCNIHRWSLHSSSPQRSHPPSSRLRPKPPLQVLRLRLPQNLHNLSPPSLSHLDRLRLHALSI